MRNFSRIPSHLQVQIAEKMSYFDQKEFEFSSKRGKKLVGLTKHKTVFDVIEIGMDEEEIYFYIEKPAEETRVQQKWSKICKCTDLPRFKTSELLIWGQVSIQSISKLIGTSDFIESKVGLKVIGRNPSQEIFAKLAQTFNITKFKADERPDPALVCLLWFRDIRDISMNIDDIPEEQLSQLKASTLQLDETTEPSRLCSLSNKYFQQWFRKQRSIDYLCICTYKEMITTDVLLNEERLLDGVPFSKVTEGPATLVAVDKGGIERSYGVEEKSHAYLIQREDQKLLIYAYESKTFNLLVAQEVTDIIINHHEEVG